MKRLKDSSKGITIISLIVTIIILIILSGISISTLTSENGIILKSKAAKEKTQIASETDILQRIVISLIGENKKNIIELEKLQKKLDEEDETRGKTKLYQDDEDFLIEFIESQRLYEIDVDGNVIQKEISEIKQDDTPGKLEGTGKETSPYIIMSIEDLVEFSKLTNERKVNRKLCKIREIFKL